MGYNGSGQTFIPSVRNIQICKGDRACLTTIVPQNTPHLKMTYAYVDVGKKTRISDQTDKAHGYVKGQHLPFCRGHHFGKEHTKHQPSPYRPSEDGLCQCGCGLVTPIAQGNNVFWGHVKGKHLAFCRGHKAKSSTTYIIDPETGCWIWQRHRIDGYGRMTDPITSKRVYAHRWYYEQKYGPIPDEMDLDHTCKNRPCVNPDHKEVVTHVVNIQRGNAATLTADQVREIRLLQGQIPHHQIAEQYGISLNTVQAIMSRRTWKNIN